MTLPAEASNAALDAAATAPCCEPSCCDDTASATPSQPGTGVREEADAFNAALDAAASAPCCGGAPNEARQDVKTTVREKYAQIATSGGSCCGGDSATVSMIGDAYDAVEGYVAEADLGLGCGLPTEHARLRPGQTVLDLGAGAGIDAFVARRLVGETGRVFGVDMTPEMVAKARANAARLGYDNVAFRLGETEALPFADASVDVIISNCVLNLVPDKRAAFAEMYRVLRPGGHFCVSDVVVRGTLPEAVRRSAELYVGCVAGAMEQGAYLGLLREAGFAEVAVVKERTLDIPDRALRPEERAALRASGAAVISATVYGVKPR